MVHGRAPRIGGQSEGTRRRRQREELRSRKRASGGPVCGGPCPPPLGEAEGVACALQTVSPSRGRTPVGLTTPCLPIPNVVKHRHVTSLIQLCESPRMPFVDPRPLAEH